MFPQQSFESPVRKRVTVRVLLPALVVWWLSAVASVAVADRFGPAGPDAFGHMGNDIPYNLRIFTAPTELNLGDDASVLVPLGFDFDWFGTTFSSVYVSSNGFLSFTSGSNPYQSGPLPGAGVPNMIAGGWTDLDPSITPDPEFTGIFVETLGTAPDREFVAEYFTVYHHLDLFDSEYTPSTFQIVLHEGSNNIEFQYDSLLQNRDYADLTSDSISVGIQNQDADDGLGVAWFAHHEGQTTDVQRAGTQGYLITTLTDVGTVPLGRTPLSPQPLSAGEVRWFRFHVPDPGAESRFLMIDTVGADTMGGGQFEDDTEIGLYDSTGGLLHVHDDIGLRGEDYLYWSRLAYGGASDLAPGDYYVAASAYDTDYGPTSFDARGFSGATGEMAVNFIYGTDLGVLDRPGTMQTQQPLGEYEVQFYRFELADDILAAEGASLVIDTIGSSLPNLFDDTEIGLYDSAGHVVAFNDDYVRPELFLARLGFGDAPDTSGDLAAGIYYLAVLPCCHFSGLWSEDFQVINGQPGVTGNIVLSLTVQLPGLPGDFNGDGVVDAADYVVWRKTDGTQAGYDTWRAHFGQHAGSGAVVAANSSGRAKAGIPEPATWALVLGGAIALGLLLTRHQPVIAWQIRFVSQSGFAEAKTRESFGANEHHSARSRAE